MGEKPTTFYNSFGAKLCDRTERTDTPAHLTLIRFGGGCVAIAPNVVGPWLGERLWLPSEREA